MKKIALPVAKNMLNQHFDHCQYFKIYNVENKMVINEELIKAPVHKSSLLPNWLANHNVTDVIAYGIRHKTIEILNQYKINVFVGVKMKNPNELVNDFLEGTLETNGSLCDH
ncbi:MAG: ATPase [Bacteroidales bacterium]|nr:ATPase [Bacteroidales bacterium]